MNARLRIAHIITGLGQGGAESVLYRLLAATRADWESTVVSLTGMGFYGERMRAAGTPVLCCEMPRGRFSMRGLRRLYGFLNALRPDVVQTWMYHADLIGGVTARLAGRRAVLWGIRNNLLIKGSVSPSSRVMAKLCAWGARLVPTVIVSCSAAAADEHKRLGYAGEKMLIIPNGYDCEQFRIDEPSGLAVRSSWGIEPDHLLVGTVARWDPLKDHGTLLDAMGRLAAERTDVRCALVGVGMDPGNTDLREMLRKQRLSDKVVLAGARTDVAAVMNALDLHVLSSISEAFPNVVAEAMACGTPCVATNVGDAALIIGDVGWLVPPSDPAALHGAIRVALERLSSSGGESLRAAARERIVGNFSTERMASAFSDAWLRALRESGCEPRPNC